MMGLVLKSINEKASSPNNNIWFTLHYTGQVEEKKNALDCLSGRPVLKIELFFVIGDIFGVHTLTCFDPAQREPYFR